MGCGCQKNKEQWQVTNEDGAVVYTGTEAAATAVGKRYPNSTVDKVAPAAK